MGSKRPAAQEEANEAQGQVSRKVEKGVLRSIGKRQDLTVGYGEAIKTGL